MQARHAVVLDFDGTCTPKGGSVFRHLAMNFMGGAGQALIKEYNDKYMALAHAGRLTEAQEKDWLYQSAQVCIDLDITDEAIYSNMASVVLREGLPECLQDLSRRDIPVAIISYGVSDFIDVVLLQQGLRTFVQDVYAMNLTRHKSGIITGFDKDSAVLPSTKGECSLDFARRNGISGKNILAVGDSGGDKTLGLLKKNRLGLAGDLEDAINLMEFMGEVLITDSFAPAHEWLIRKIEGSR